MIELLHLGRQNGWEELRKAMERAPGRPTKVQRFTEYLLQRWAEGCHDATRLFKEIRTQGYRGGRSMVARHVATWKNSSRPVPATCPRKITPKHAAILITRPLDQLTVEQQELLDQLSGQCPDLHHHTR